MSTNDLTRGLVSALDGDPGHLRLLGDRLAAAAQAEDILDVAYRTVDSPVGPLLLAATEVGLVRVAYAAEDHDTVLQTLADRISPRILRAPARLDATASELEEYFNGRRRNFDVPLDWRLTAGFRRTVLHHLPEISYGQTATYASVARLGRQSEGIPRRRHRLCDKPVACRGAVPSGGSVRRRHGPLPRRRRRQAHPAHPGDDTMSAATARRAAATASAPDTSARVVPSPWRKLVNGADWAAISAGLDAYGCALIGPLLNPDEADVIAALYTDDSRFRSTINMARYRFGEGEYRYFAEPFPEAVLELKQALYPRLLPIAREWWTRLGRADAVA